jgi:uncharacterized protein YlxW (UPF0749 family)
MPNSVLYVPGELGFKPLLLAIAFFLAFDILVYREFSNLFPHAQQTISTPQVSNDQKIATIEARISTLEQKAAALEIQINATKNSLNKNRQSNGKVKGTGVSRREFELLRCEVRRLKNNCCDPARPCEP